MFQKKNDLEIIELLAKQDTHLRNIAKKISVSPSTTMRILHGLVKENVLDYREEGKNKVYCIKDTLEAMTYLQVMESYKLLKLIIKKPALKRIIKLLITNTNNEMILLFGSYAKYLDDKNSDIDVYIETNDKRLRENLSKLSNKLSIKIGKFNKESLLSKEMIKNHIIIQGIDRYLYLKK